jgi:hypothetical protein
VGVAQVHGGLDMKTAWWRVDEVSVVDRLVLPAFSETALSGRLGLTGEGTGRRISTSGRDG